MPAGLRTQMPRLHARPFTSTFFIAKDAPIVCARRQHNGWAGCEGRGPSVRRSSCATHGYGLAEGIVEVAVHQASFADARLACRARDNEV